MTVPIRRIPVQLGQRSYEIIVGRGLLPNLKTWLRPLGLGKHCAIITDRNVSRLFSKKVVTALNPAPRGVNADSYQASLTVIPAGEKAKTLAQTAKLYNALLKAGLNRDGFVIGLGGGVVGDLAGFVAATYMRGIKFIQVPTTLVAQVDAAIGGKTGVDLSSGKNLVGAFWQPRLVLCDLDTLRTLPPREYRAGWAEVIKYGIIRDADLFGALEKFLLDLSQSRITSHQLPIDIVACCCQIKAEIVSADERESDLRAILNFGHTLGHALEAATNYKKYLHGEAVSIGMVAAARLSVKRAGLPVADAERIRTTLEAAGLPTEWPKKIPAKKILTAISLDKKVRAGKLRFVLARRLGDAFLSSAVTLDDVREVMR